MRMIIVALCLLIVAIIDSSFPLESASAPRSREQCRQMADAQAYMGVSGRQRAARNRFMKRCMEGKSVKNVKR